MGEVYLAQDTKLDRKVALKILSVDVASNHKRMERYVHEAKSAAAFNHPNYMAHICEIGEGKGPHFIAMEIVEGVALRAKINQEKGLRYVPRVIITDRLRSYGAARAEVLPSFKHCHDKGLNNRAKNSHPTRLRERVMRRFKSPGHAQRFLSVFGILTHTSGSEDIGTELLVIRR